jgi:hypothetical protein
MRTNMQIFEGNAPEHLVGAASLIAEDEYFSSLYATNENLLVRAWGDFYSRALINGETPRDFKLVFVDEHRAEIEFVSGGDETSANFHTVVIDRS